MNIKSLLLGSAAALVAVSGARAADAVEVVAEPEPMEYVQICDTYGAGFYYIPGTQTCLRVGGYIRYDIGVGDLFGQNDILDKQDAANRDDDDDSAYNTNDTYYKRARAAIQLDARSDTELGMLRGYIHINYNFDSSWGPSSTLGGRGTGDELAGVGVFTDASDGFEINHAYIELGGFRIGKTDSMFSEFTGFAGEVINDDIVGFGRYGTHQIAYRFDASNGFTAAVALEEGDGSVAIDTDDDGDLDTDLNRYTIDSYIPHVVAGVGYTGGWGSVRVVGGYDSVWEEFAVKARLDVKASETISVFVMGGYKSDDATPNYYGNWGGDWAVWGGATAQVSEKAAVNVQVSYDDGDNFAAVANVGYELVPGFKITPEVAYYDDLDNDDEDGQFGGFLRFQRNF